MHIINKITLTGVDRYTDLTELAQVVSDFQRNRNLKVELAFLVTAKEDSSPRTLSYGAALERAAVFNGYGIPTALHLCGEAALEDWVDQNTTDMPEHCSRVQLNGSAGAIYSKWSARLQDKLQMHRNLTLIFQHNGESSHLNFHIPRYGFLMDSSAGRGVKPEEWKTIHTNVPIGFAGGLNALNMFSEYRYITDVARPGAWIDLETGLRDGNDYFSLDKAYAVLSQFCSAVESARYRNR